MYKTLPYHSCYDDDIERHALAIIREFASLKGRTIHKVVSPKVTKEVIKKNKARTKQVNPTTLDEIVLAHAQQFMRFSTSQPIEVIEQDLSRLVNSMIVLMSAPNEPDIHVC